MSARHSSVWITSMSEIGSTLPATWITLSSSKQRTTLTMASVSRMCGEELVAQAFALGGAGHQAGDVDELDDGRHDALGLDDLGQLRQARIGHFDHADVGLDGAEGIVLGRDAGLGQRVEEGGLADVGQADDAALEAHGGCFQKSWGNRSF